MQGVINGGKKMCRAEILSNDPNPHTVLCSNYYPYYFNTNFGTYEKPTEDIIKELEEEIVNLEKELSYKRRLLAYLLGLPKLESK
jgi:hypothetical protein